MDRGMDGKAASDDTAHPAPAGSAARAPPRGCPVPCADGAPDQGTEGIRFMGYTLYDPLIMWDLSSATEPAKRDTGSALRWRRTAAPGRDTASGLRPAAAVPYNA